VFDDTLYIIFPQDSFYTYRSTSIDLLISNVLNKSVYFVEYNYSDIDVPPEWLYMNTLFVMFSWNSISEV